MGPPVAAAGGGVVGEVLVTGDPGVSRVDEAAVEVRLGGWQGEGVAW